MMTNPAMGTEPKQETRKPEKKSMTTPSVSLGYVILYVKDVAASLTFYEEVFGLKRRFFHDNNGKADDHETR